MDGRGNRDYGDFASAPYRDHKAPEDFVRALIENYGSRKDLEAKLAAAGVRLKPGIWADDAGERIAYTNLLSLASAAFFGASSAAMNCARASAAKRPFFATSSSKLPCSTISPASKTKMRSACG